MTLTDDDRLWRDQHIPNASDDELEKIIHTFSQQQEQSKTKQEHQETFEQQLRAKLIRENIFN